MKTVPFTIRYYDGERKLISPDAEIILQSVAAFIEINRFIIAAISQKEDPFQAKYKEISKPILIDLKFGSLIFSFDFELLNEITKNAVVKLGVDIILKGISVVYDYLLSKDRRKTSEQESHILDNLFIVAERHRDMLETLLNAALKPIKEAGCKISAGRNDKNYIYQFNKSDLADLTNELKTRDLEEREVKIIQYNANSNTGRLMFKFQPTYDSTKHPFFRIERTVTDKMKIALAQSLRNVTANEPGYLKIRFYSVIRKDYTVKSYIIESLPEER